MIVKTFALLILLTGCTYSINMVHTEGTAEDVVDTDQGATADVKPELSIPVKPL